MDGKLSSPAVKQACRRKNREYLKNGNSAKYKRLKKKVKNKIKDAAAKVIINQVKNVAVKDKSWLKHVKNITSRPGEQLPQHIEENLSMLESSNRICQYFSSISQEYPPLDPDKLPERVRVKLRDDPCHHPYLDDHIVHEGLKKGKITCSVPGDLPAKILNEFLPELTTSIAATLGPNPLL